MLSTQLAIFFKKMISFGKRGFISYWFDTIENCVQEKKGIALGDRE